ncbi:MAG: hypothetical protein ACI4PC_10410 [Oscillospiraceae bacterium]
MKIKKLKRSIEQMPRPAYIFLKLTLMLCCAMLALSLVLYGSGSREARNLALLFLESPAGVLLLGGIGVCFMLDRC